MGGVLGADREADDARQALSGAWWVRSSSGVFQTHVARDVLCLQRAACSHAARAAAPALLMDGESRLQCP